MLHFEKVAAQGELTITRLTKGSASGTPVEPQDGRLIVGHSETGHHHVVDADTATLTRVDQFTSFLTVHQPSQIDHLRDFDTHPSIALQPGMYEIRTGREYDPFAEIVRASQD